MPPPPGYMPYQAATGMPQFASWGARVGGHIINSLSAGLFVLPALVSLFAVPREVQVCTIDGDVGLCEVPTGAGWAIIIGLYLAGLIAFAVVYSKSIARSGQFWGHKAAGVRIVDAQSGGNISAGKAFGRWLIGAFVNGLPCYLGYLWPLWDKQKQTFGDKIFGTFSVKA
jgi:uncharacterized RDD family membrane protein YckC